MPGRCASLTAHRVRALPSAGALAESKPLSTPLALALAVRPRSDLQWGAMICGQQLSRFSMRSRIRLAVEHLNAGAGQSGAAAPRKPPLELS